jgi:hypothetical protein
MNSFSATFPRIQARLTTVGTTFEQLKAYPQAWWIRQSCSYWATGFRGRLTTRLNKRQVVDQKEENRDVHRNVLPLSTTTNLN